MKFMFLPLNHLQQSSVWTHLLITSTVVFFIFIFYKACQNKASSTLPPSPPRLPLLGNFHQLSSLPHKSLQVLSHKYGPLMLVHFGGRPTIVISSSQLAREVMKNQDLVFASRPSLRMVKRLMYDCDLVFAPYGEYWRQVRRICVLHLLSIKRVQSFWSPREEEVTLLVEKIRISYPQSVNLSKMIVTLTNDIISRVALGKKYSEHEVQEMFKEFALLMGSFPIGDFIPCLAWIDTLKGMDARVRRNFKKIDGFLERVLEEHLHSETRPNNNNGEEFSNFVEVLLSLNHEADEGNISLTRDNIKAIILDMFIGGTDTTFTALEWAMSELMRNPDVMRRVQVEVRGIAGCKEKIAEADLERMKYLKSVIKETLRLHPPIPLLVPRETTDDVKLQGYKIPVGTQVMINAWAIARDPSSWDRPEDFFPDRFMNSDVDFRGQDFQLIPFGSGRRGCPGLGFANAVIELTLAHLLCHFDWEMPNGMRGELLDMSETRETTILRKSDLILVARPRDL